MILQNEISLVACFILPFAHGNYRMIMKYKPCKILMIQEKQGKEKKKQIIGHRVPFMDICEGGDDD
jgi:hypothetical protein